jgi:bifunctional UDP-N-acetylglucosamine pyrophosphorylase/glucosamine-1-phosphate N-acetyltransferase
MVDLAAAASCEKIVTVISQIPELRAHFEKHLPKAVLAVQEPALGTAHAALQGKAALANFPGDVVVLLNDTPLIRKETLEAMFAARERADFVVLAFRAKDPFGYGRLVTGAAGVEKIVEEKDATPEERKVDLCNSGVFVAPAKLLFALLERVDNKNAKGEYYITDIVGLARADGKTITVVEAPEDELRGANKRAELAELEAAFQQIRRAEAFELGVTMIDPATVYFSHDTKLARDVTIEPNVFLGPGVSVGAGTVIRAFSHIEGATIGEDCQIGPFARLRPGADLARDVKVGNFVEIKNATLEEGAKASHLSYLGDADIGAGANIGAGTITCNYDGFDKFRTKIGAGVFVGSDTALVAPVTVGDGAFIGAGSVITKDVAPNSLAVARGKQADIAGWADKFRARKKAERDAKKT